MSKTDTKGAPSPKQQGGGNVTEMGAKQVCVAEGCKAKPARAEFCNEHFTWFKEGLINKKGERPKDFDKKYVAFTQRKQA